MVLTRSKDTNVFDEPNLLMRVDRIFDAILPYVVRGSSPVLKESLVMDLACGWGLFGKKFAERGARVIFIDGREKNLEKARSAGPDHGYSCQDVTSHGWYPPKVDIALCLGILYHVSDPMTLLQKISRAPVLVVDSLCLDHDGNFLVKLAEDTEPVDYSLNGGACRPSPGWNVDAWGKLE